MCASDTRIPLDHVPVLRPARGNNRLSLLSPSHPQFFYNGVGVPGLSNDHCGSKISAGLFCSFNLNIVHLHATIGTKVYLVHLIFLPATLPLLIHSYGGAAHHYSSSPRAPRQRRSRPVVLLELSPFLAGFLEPLLPAPCTPPLCSVASDVNDEMAQLGKLTGLASPPYLSKFGCAHASCRRRCARGRFALQFLFSNLTFFPSFLAVLVSSLHVFR
jgi:hypothetical protein